MSGTHLVAVDYRWGKNPLRSFLSEHSPTTSRWGYLSPATCRLGMARQFARERAATAKKLSKSLDLVQDPTHLQLAGPARQAIQIQFKPVTQIVLTSWRHPCDRNATTFPKILTISIHSGPSPTTNTSAVRNTVGRGKEKLQENPNEPASDAALREFCDKNYNQLLPILAEKMHQEKVQQEKLKAIKARLNFEGTSQHSESGAPSRRMDVRKRLGPKDARSMSKSPEPRRDPSRSPRRKDPERETVFTIWLNREPVG
ncbi:hypothetical protein Tco_0788980 [Tanacetum coccineum]